jgi:hypothetical protein
MGGDKLPKIEFVRVTRIEQLPDNIEAYPHMILGINVHLTMSDIKSLFDLQNYHHKKTGGELIYKVYYVKSGFTYHFVLDTHVLRTDLTKADEVFKDELIKLLKWEN